MAYVRVNILIILLFFCRPIWAQDKAYALVRSIQGIETLPPALARQLEKIGLQVVAMQPGYELMLSGTDTPSGSVVEMVAVEPEVSRKGDYFRVEARLIDVRTKKLLAKASRDHIREEDVIRLFQGAMEAIFLGHHSEGETEEKEKQNSTSPKDRPKVPITTQTNSPDGPTIDFKKRISDLKLGVDKKIVKAVEDKKEEEENKKREGESSIIRALSKSGQLEADAVSEKPGIEKTYARTHVLSLAYENRQIKSVGLVETATKTQAETFKASGHIPRPLFDGKTGYSYDFAYSVVQSDVKTPSIYQLGLYGSLLYPNWNFSVGLFKDASFFVNLATPGEGLQPVAIASTWTRVKGEVTLPFSRPWKLAASYGTPFKVDTGYKQVAGASKWQGSHVHIDLTPHFEILTCEINLMLETLDLSTQGEVPFTFNESRLGLSLRRSL